MATLLFTAVGTALGGPLGGALGALAGRQLDSAIIGSPRREGPRLTELAVTTSSYGSIIARQFGRVRSSGTVIWATDLKEDREKSGGSKGKPAITTYSYSVSFAVALSSRPIQRIGRIWADGRLLRGEAGDLKVGGTMRLYQGHGDQDADPLIASAEGVDQCPAFRGVAYVVFENLQLADFGNRIPALTFEIFADDGTLALFDLMKADWIIADQLGPGLPVESDRELPGLLGFSHANGTLVQLLEVIHSLYPVACESGDGILHLNDATAKAGTTVLTLPPPASGGDEDFGSATGVTRTRDGRMGPGRLNLRYYDLDRDFQPGLQRSRSPGLSSRTAEGGIETIEFPGTFSADGARRLADDAASRLAGRREAMAYRVATLDPAIRPGAFVRLVGENGLWQVNGWEWRERGIELELEAVPPILSVGLSAAGDSGRTRPPADLLGGTSVLSAFELPWDGSGNGDMPALYAAVSSPAEGWTGAALYADAADGALLPLGAANRRRAVIGTAMTLLRPASPHVIDRENTITIALVGADLALDDADLDALALGANRARIGEEILQFGRAVVLGDGRWRLSLLLRGRAGTEQTIGSHVQGEDFVLLDHRLTLLDPALATDGANASDAHAIVALGNDDADPVVAPLRGLGATLRPLTPVHGAAHPLADGGLRLSWTRRARGAWRWLDRVEVPLHEPQEAYEIAHVAPHGAAQIWRTAEPRLTLDAAAWAALSPDAKARFEVRQIGRVSLSEPLVITIS